MRRPFAIVAGLAVAVPVACLTLLACLAIALVWHGSGSTLPFLALNLIHTLAWSPHPDRLVTLAVGAATEGLAVVCCAPVICTALIGEVAQIERPLWFAGLTAAFTVVLPFTALGGAALGSVAAPLAIGPLLATGAVAGLCYGAIAAPARPVQPSSPNPGPASSPAASSPSPPASA